MNKYTHDVKKEAKYRVTEFKGLAEKCSAEKGEFEELYGFSSSLYPCLTTQKNLRVGDEKEGAEPLVFSSDKTGYVLPNGTLYYGNDIKTDFLSPVSEGTTRKCVMLGALACFFPDKKWYNTADRSSGNMEIHKVLPTVQSEDISVGIKFDDGTEPCAYTYQVSEPSSPVNGQLWCSKQPSGNILAQRYFSSCECWIPQDRLWYCITSLNAGTDMFEGDYVTVSGCASSEKVIDGFSGAMRVCSVEENSVCLSATPEIWLCAHICRENSHSYRLTEIRFDRNIPDFAYICSSGNRLWGCSKDGHEIRSSALGNICSWECFDGNESDSWAVEIGSPCEFTGCSVVDSNPVFFKENEVIRIYGSKPSAFAVSSDCDIGVKKGHDKSLCCIADSLYYMGADGFYRRNSGKARLLSRYLDIDCEHSFSAALGSKYYTVTVSGDGKKKLYIYDTVTGIWHTQDSANCDSLFSNGTELFGVRECGDNGKWQFVSLDRLSSGGEIDTVTFKDEESGSFSLKTGNLLDFDSEYCVREITLDVKGAKGCVCGVFAFENESKIPITVGYIYGNSSRMKCKFTLPQNVCYSFKAALSGKGEFTLYGISVTGSEVV